MDTIQALTLGIIQGITEFLPISSSGHLIALPKLFGWNDHSLLFDIVLHLGTALALILYFFSDLAYAFAELAIHLSKRKLKFKYYSKEAKLGAFIIVGSIPAAVIGFLLEDYIETVFRGLIPVAIFLLLGSALMYFAEKSITSRTFLDRLTDSKASLKKSVIVGFFQALALLPGFSRSGSTISGGMLLGFDRAYAARFSFLLSVPIVVGAGSLKIIMALNEGVFLESSLILFIGFFSSFVTGVLTIKFLLDFLNRNSLYSFIVYRVLLALLLFGVAMV